MNRKKNDNILIIILLILLAVAIYFEVGICLKAIRQERENRKIAAQQNDSEQDDVQAAKTESEEKEPLFFEKGEKWNLIEQIDTVDIQGRVESEDYPYGYNAGKIEDDIVGIAVLITPGTKIVCEGIIPENAVLQMDYLLHPWVAANSDGSVLTIQITAKGTENSFSYEIDERERQTELDLSQYAEQKVSICISVTNEEEKSEDCDWVILKEFSLE